MSRSELHVVLCTDGVFPHAMGGMQRHSRLLAEHLAKREGMRLTVMHPHGTNVFDPSFGIEEVRIPAIDTEGFYMRELWRYSSRIGKELERVRPDVILSQGFCVWQGIDRFSDRLVVHPHGLEMFQGLSLKERLFGMPFRWALRSIARRSAVVISLGGKLTAILQHLVQGSSCRVVVIPNAVEVADTVTAYPQGDAPVRMLFVGRFAFNKGLDVLLAVARRLCAEGRANDVRFELAGDGPLLKSVEQEGVPANLKLLGRVDDDTLARLYAECHALVLPTRFEGMPTVVLEAMAQARPIFVSDVGATAELVNMHNGYLLPAGDPGALYDAIEEFLTRSGEVRMKMGAYSRRRVEELFSWRINAHKFASLFEEVASGASPKAGQVSSARS